MKMFKTLRVLILAAFMGVWSPVEAQAYPISSHLTEEGIYDVIELLKFARQVKPQTFDEYAAAFEDVGMACDAQKRDEELLERLALILDRIEDEMPKSNKRLHSLIALAALIHRLEKPVFINKNAVLENMSLYVTNIFAAYEGNNFGECRRLVSYAAQGLGPIQNRFASTWN